MEVDGQSMPEDTEDHDEEEDAAEFDQLIAASQRA